MSPFPRIFPTEAKKFARKQMKANGILVSVRMAISDTGMAILGKTLLQMLSVKICIDMLLYTTGVVSEVFTPLIQIPVQQQKTWILAEFLLFPIVHK